MSLSAYQLRYGFDPYERARNMYAALATRGTKAPSYDHHVVRRPARREERWIIESQRVRGRLYVVRKTAARAFTCTCKNFRDQADARYQCKHIYVARTDEAGGRVPSRRLR